MEKSLEFWQFIKSVIAKIVLKEEFESKLDYLITTGYRICFSKKRV